MALNMMLQGHCSAWANGGASTSGRCFAPTKHSYSMRRTGLMKQGRWQPTSRQARIRNPCIVLAAAATEEQPVEEFEDEEKGGEQPVGKIRKQERLPFDNSPDVYEKGAPGMPLPGEFQQTLVRSFTLGGIGLHTGDYGTNANHFKMEEKSELPHPAQAEPASQELETMKVTLFQNYLMAQEEDGFEGTFQQFLHLADAKEILKTLDQGKDPNAEWGYDNPEPIQARREDEQYLLATIDNVHGKQAISTWLGEPADDAMCVASVELLLSALEACGVDNCRIEIEGGYEIPILDGSALGWAIEIQFAGVCLAPLPGSDEFARKVALRPKDPISVHGDDGAFVAIFPEDTMRLTVGIDHYDEAPIIGKQWKSWSMFEDLHYRFELAGARTYTTCPEQAVALREFGFLKGGTEGCMLIGFGERWYDPQMLRFVRDEPVRHALCDIIGDLALNAEGGHSGMPIGHIIAYKADHDLHMQFVRALRAGCTDEDYVPMVEMTSEVEEAAEELVEDWMKDLQEGKVSTPMELTIAEAAAMQWASEAMNEAMDEGVEGSEGEDAEGEEGEEGEDEEGMEGEEGEGDETFDELLRRLQEEQGLDWSEEGEEAEVVMEGDRYDIGEEGEK